MKPIVTEDPSRRNRRPVEFSLALDRIAPLVVSYSFAAGLIEPAVKSTARPIEPANPEG
jgi:hypothetical protein